MAAKAHRASRPWRMASQSGSNPTSTRSSLRTWPRSCPPTCSPPSLRHANSYNRTSTCMQRTLLPPTPASPRRCTAPSATWTAVLMTCSNSLTPNAPSSMSCRPTTPTCPHLYVLLPLPTNYTQRGAPGPPQPGCQHQQAGFHVCSQRVAGTLADAVQLVHNAISASFHTDTMDYCPGPTTHGTAVGW